MKPNPDKSIVNVTGEIVRKYEESILKLKNQLQQQEQKLQLFESLSNFIPGAFFRFKADKNGRFYMDYLSKSAERIYNKPISVLMDPDKMLEDFHPDDKEGFISSIQISMSELDLWDHVYRVKSNRDDSYIWIHGKSMPEECKDGTIIWDGLLLDITQQKNTEQEVIKQKEEYEKLVNKMIDGYAFHKIIADENGNAVDYETLKVNQAYENNLHVKSTDIVGKLASEILPVNELKKWLEVFGPVALKGETIKYTIYSEHNNKYFEGTAFSSGLGYFKVVFLDVTDQKKHEKELIEAKEKAEESENQFKVIAEHSTEGITIADSDGKYVYVNSKFCEMSGYSEDELLKMTAFDMAAEPINREKALSGFRSKENISGEIHNVILRKKDGTKYHTEIKGTRIEINKQQLILGFIRDVTEIVKNNDDLIAAKVKAEEGENKFRIISDNSPDAIFITDKAGDYIYVNDEATKLLGYSKKELLRMNVMSISENLKNNIDVNAYNKIFSSGKHFYETNLIHQNGAVVPVDLNAVLLENGTLYASCRDISDRKNYEEQLIGAKIKAEEGENKFRIISDNSPDAIFITDKAGDYIYVNDEAEKLLGYSKKELLKMNIIDIGEKFKRDNNIDAYTVLFSGEKQSYEAKLIHKNGTLIPVELNAVLLENGTVYASCRDISVRKLHEKEIIKAKEKAEENEKIFKDLFNNINSGVAIYDVKENGEDFIFKFFNDGAERIDRQSRNDIIGKSIFEARPKIGEFGLVDTFRKVIKTKQPLNHPVQIYKDNILDGYYENYVFILPTGELVAVFDDITERMKFEMDLKSAKEKAEESDFRLKLATDSGKLGIWDWNITENLITWNERMFELYGITENTFTTNFDSWLNALHPDDKEGAIMDSNRALYENKEYNTIFRVVHPDNTVLHIKADAIVLRDDKNNPVRMIGINRDITELVSYQDELLKAKEKAEESDRLKSAFLANMSHEIRTPMNGIIGFTNLLKEPGLTGKDSKRFIEIIQKSSDRLLNTVNDIIEISKIETGQIIVKLSKVNINKHLLTLKDLFSFELQNKGLELQIENKLSEEESEIKTDKLKLGSVISNLLKNAIKFTDHGVIKLGCNRKDNLLEIYVSDEGIGIPENRKDAIFNRFVQADIGESRGYEGSGLGLSIAKSYVEMLGGKIWVESEENKGSTFYFTIPLDDTQYKLQKSITKPDENNEPVKKGLKILVAEDDEVSGMHLDIILKEVAQEIIFVNTGTKAVETVKKYTDIDLVLMDVRMPDMDGLDATRLIREFNNDIIIIAQTAFALEGDKQKAISAGCNDYISKPFYKKDLIQLIHKYK